MKNATKIIRKAHVKCCGREVRERERDEIRVNKQQRYKVKMRQVKQSGHRNDDRRKTEKFFLVRHPNAADKSSNCITVKKKKFKKC